MNTEPTVIICGTDFSPGAVEAGDIAAGIARKSNAKLLLTHVEQFRGLALSDPVLFGSLISSQHAELHRAAERLRKLGTIVEEKLRSGSIFNEIIDLAAEVNAQLVIVGAVGHGLARRLFVGSVAERVAETSPVPTLVVRPGSRLGTWLRGEHPLRILVGYNFLAVSDAALRWVKTLQEIGPCEIKIVFIDWPPEEADRLAYHGALPLTENPPEIQKVLERELAEHVAKVFPPGSVTMEVTPGWGRTDAYLFELAHRGQHDLVVVGADQRHGGQRLRAGSVSRSLLHHVSASVAVVPSNKTRNRHEDQPSTK